MYPLRVLKIVSLFSTLCAATLVGSKFKGPNDPARFSYFDTATPGEGPCDITSGPKDTIWYQQSSLTKIGVLHTKTGKVQDFDIPWFTGAHGTPPFVGTRVAAQCGLKLGADGFIYGTNTQRENIFRTDPETGNTTIISLHIPVPYSYHPDGAYLAATPHGIVVTQTTYNLISYIPYNKVNTTKKGNFTNYRLPQPESGPVGAFTDGKCVWISEFFGQRITCFDLKTRKFTEEYNVTKPANAFPNLFSMTGSRHLWISAFGGDGFLRFDTQTKKIKNFTSIPAAAGFYPSYTDTDGDENVWFSSSTRNELAYYTPKTGEWTNIHFAKNETQPGYNQTFPVHYGPGNSMWFTDLETLQIGRYKLD